jgi:hypothetical protein
MVRLGGRKQLFAGVGQHQVATHPPNQQGIGVNGRENLLLAVAQLLQKPIDTQFHEETSSEKIVR